MAGFQKQVNANQAPAVAGDFASSNPRATVLAGPGGLIAGASGVTVGRFSWVLTDGVTAQSNAPTTRAPDGFVHRDTQALIQNYLAESSMNIPTGFAVTLFNEGDFWALNTGPAAFAVNDLVYTVSTSGAISNLSTDIVATGWKAKSVAAVGELVKISTRG
jgi:hypothetical protein